MRFSLWPPQVGFGYKREGISREVYPDLIKDLEPGDIIFTGKTGYVASLVNAGTVSHVAVYVGDSFDPDYKHGVVHAVDPYVMIQELAAITCCEHIEVWRLGMPLEPSDFQVVKDRLRVLLDKKVSYDNRFISSIDSSEEKAETEMYCSELVAYAFAPFVEKYHIDFKERKKLGVPAYLPSEFIHEGSGFYKVFGNPTK